MGTTHLCNLYTSLEELTIKLCGEFKVVHVIISSKDGFRNISIFLKLLASFKLLRKSAFLLYFLAGSLCNGQIDLFYATLPYVISPLFMGLRFFQNGAHLKITFRFTFYHSDVYTVLT